MRRRTLCKNVLFALSALGLLYLLYAKSTERSVSYQHEPSHRTQVKRTPQEPPNPDGQGVIKTINGFVTYPTEMSRRKLEIPPGCRQAHCKEYLSASDNKRWKKCSQKVASTFKTSEVKQGECRFMNRTGKEPVALLSHPGSGNTWLRVLLEKTTGICTGAIYCDVDLRAQGFVGEGVRGASVIAVKSHDSSAPWEESSACDGDTDRFCYGSAILLVRNPYDAFVAELNRQVTEHLLKPARADHQQGHINAVPDVYFSGPEWDDYLQNQTVEWETRMRRWIVLGDHPLLVVHYEDVQHNVQGEVQRMLEFLGIDYATVDLRQKIEEAKAVTTFKRKKNDRYIDPYTDEQKVLINRTIQKVKVFLSQYNMEDLLKVERYMRT